MRIESVTLVNFRCFGPDAEKVRLSDLTTLVGTNASGKTALLQSLQRVFGMSGSERELKPEDFHVPIPSDPFESEAVTNRSLSIEVRLEFPELENPFANEDAVAECFRQMVVTKPGEAPFCCVRLEGEWTATGLPEGVVEQHTYWVRPGAEDSDAEVKHEMKAADRARIRLHYVPATRDPIKHIRHVSGSIMARLFNAVNWSDNVKADVARASAEIQAAFGAEDGVVSIQAALSKTWKTLHDASAYSAVKVQPVSGRFEDLLRQVDAVFSPSPGGEDDPLERLSDGQRSLFYLAMVGAAFDIEGAVLAADDGDETFDLDRLSPPSLTVFAVEEPENHIAPHLLGRITQVLRKMTASERAQVILTSHSASILHRVEPEEVRHLRLDKESRTSLVREIRLPPDTDECHKFIREAVRAYPELYFARLVVLGEGDSEEIVLPKLTEAHQLPIDQSFVSIVPLGGRHVNHMWQLLKSLNIPHVTLLDLDRERKGGGWGRVQYTVKQLLAGGAPKADLLSVADAKGRTRTLPDDELAKMHTWAVGEGELEGWITRLEEYDVFFSSPLDLDFLMLQHFTDAYHEAVKDGRGPTIPADEDEDAEDENRAAIRAVLKEAGGNGGTYSSEERQEFFWYRYLFLSRGKPTTHLTALAAISDEQLRSKCPPVLERLIKRMKQRLASAGEDGPDA